MIKARSRNYYSPAAPKVYQRQLRHGRIKCISPRECDFYSRSFTKSSIFGIGRGEYGSSLKAGYLPEDSIWQDCDTDEYYIVIGEELSPQEMTPCLLE